MLLISGGDEEKSLETDRVKKLSPAEPILNISLKIDLPRTYPVSKAEKTARLKYGWITRTVSPYTLEILVKSTIQEIQSLVEDVKEFLEELPVDTMLCIDTWITLRRVSIEKCREGYVVGEKSMIVEVIDDKTVYMYCNLKKKYVTIRIVDRKVENIDPLQIPKTLFITCGDKLDVVETLDKLTGIENIIEYVMNALSN